MSKVFRLAVDEWEILNRNPGAGVKAPRQPDGKLKYLTPGELRATLEASPEWMRAPIALAAATGCRRGELLALRWMDIDLQRRQLTLRGRNTKTRETRILRLNEPAMHVLRSLPQGAAADLLFPDVDAHELTVYTQRIFARLGIADASFHTLRHSYASWLAMQGVDLYAISALLGHKTPRMTQRYAHLSPDYQAAAGKLDGVLGGIWPALPAGQPDTLPEGQPEPKPASLSHRSVTRKFSRKAKTA